MGPNYSISTACATANYCFCAAANHIRRGESDIMVVGGSEAPIVPIGVAGFIACRSLSQRNGEPQKASRPWDRNRDGFVIGEGSGVLLIMESLESAMKRGANIIAKYLGGAVTCDAHHMTDPRQDGLGVSSCIDKSLEDAGVSPDEVNYINAHATSTLAADLAVVNAIKKVFKNTSKIKMNGTKDQVTGCILRNMKKKAVALGRVNFSAPPNDENFAVLIDEIIDGSMELCVGDGTLGDLFPGETIEWPHQYVTRAPGSGN